ncbi:MAG TPA: hypothetical protein VLC50_07520 [Actinomycetes bacterium]|nr:hypothetical protein [Actinomycetes bacterium]
MLRAMRDQTGAPSKAIRVLAVIVVIGMIALASPVIPAVLAPALRWFLGVL